MAWLRVDVRTSLTVLTLIAAALGSIARADEPAPDWRDRALALNDITGQAPIQGEIQKLLDRPADAKKILAAATPLAREKNPPFNYNAALILGKVGLGVKDYQASQVFFRICAEQATKLRSVQKLVESYVGFLEVIDGLYADEKYEQTSKLCQSFLEMLEREPVRQGLKDDVLRMMIRALARQGKMAEANRMVDNLIKARGSDWRNIDLKGWLQREEGKYEEAARSYEHLLSLIKKDRSLGKSEQDRFARDIHYLLSSVYIDLNKVDKAEEQLKLLLKAKPDDPGYNNDLGYIWADHNMHLDEAEEMIRKAIALDRQQRQKNPEAKASQGDNAAYLDSLGWVLFKKKKYAEAREYLLQAVREKEGQHVEIFDHLGDVYMALGDKAHAIAAWKKGVAAAGPSRREQEKKTEVEKKLRSLQEQDVKRN